MPHNKFLKTTILAAICLACTGEASAQTITPQWWWQAQPGTALNNATITLSGASATSKATGANVVINKSIAAQPPLLLIGGGSGGGAPQGYTIAAASPLTEDLQLSIANPQSTLPANTPTTYTFTVRNLSATTSNARLVMSWGNPPNYNTLPTPTFSNPACSFIPSGGACANAGAKAVLLTIPPSSVAQVTWSATTVGAVLTRMAVTGYVYSTAGNSNVTPFDNNAYNYRDIK
jgi:hypothetical protein